MTETEFTMAAARKRLAEKFKIAEELGVVEKDDSVVAKKPSPTPERVRPQRLVGPNWAPLATQ
ncbi:MAG: hypothetical protein Q8P17_04890 [bacterium]|nr:hypothetical protein [bacterium]